MKPIIKWAGGKRQLLGELRRRMPKEFNNYYEPFFGAGALFFDIKPDCCSYINDSNHSLVNLYNCIKLNEKELFVELQTLEDDFNSSSDKEKFYYDKRSKYNEILNKDSFEEAGLLIFLNRSDYNGLYRVNSKGKFNVPFGKKKKINLMSDRIFELNSILKNTNILEGDFEPAVQSAKKGDFVYFDPPYDNSFTEYQSSGFGKNEQIRLFNLFERLTNEGVYCMLSNSATPFMRELYKNYNISLLPVKRLINRNPKGREDHEIIVTNYKYD